MSCEENAGHYHNIKMGNKSFERIQSSDIWGQLITNPNCINEEIQSRIKKQNASYQLIQKYLSYHFHPNV